MSSEAHCYDTYVDLASFPGSPPPFLFFVGARGEPGNEANVDLNHISEDILVLDKTCPGSG